MTTKPETSHLLRSLLELLTLWMSCCCVTELTGGDTLEAENVHSAQARGEKLGLNSQIPVTNTYNSAFIFVCVGSFVT